MSEKKIIQFDSASQVNSDAYVPITQLVNGDQKTLKALIDQLGAYISRVQQYNDLDTTDKSLIGAINEAAQSGSNEMESTVTTPVSIASFNDGGDNIPVKSLKVLVSAVQSGSGTPSPSNIRAISGWSGAKVSSTGKNLFDYNNYQIIDVTGASVFRNGHIFPSGTYTVKNNSSVTDFYYKIVKSDLSSYSTAVQVTSNASANVTVADGYLLYVYSSYTPSDIMVARGENQTYEPFGTTHTIPFGQTVYGGVLDVTNGVLTVTHGLVTPTSSSTVYGQARRTGYWAFTINDEASIYKKDGNVISNINIPVSYQSAQDSSGFALATNDNGKPLFVLLDSDSGLDSNATQAQIQTAFQTFNSTYNPQAAYELYTPIVINLTPTQVKTILNQNNIFADCGDIDTLIYFNGNADEVADVVEAYIGNVVNLYATLATGNTSVTITSSAIHTNSTIDIYTDNDVDYISAVVTEGQIVITFEAQASDLGVKVRVS